MTSVELTSASSNKQYPNTSSKGGYGDFGIGPRARNNCTRDTTYTIVDETNSFGYGLTSIHTPRGRGHIHTNFPKNGVFWLESPKTSFGGVIWPPGGYYGAWRVH